MNYGTNFKQMLLSINKNLLQSSSNIIISHYLQ